MPIKPQSLNTLSRRRFLKAAGLLATLPLSTAAKSNTRVTIAGAGIVGASIGYALARAGAAVTLIDERGPATLSSLATFAWINATWAKQPRHYHRLSQLSVALWHELEAELSIPVQWHGSIEWFESSQRQAKLAADIKEQIEWGEPASMLFGSALDPYREAIDFKGTKQVAFSPNDGAVDSALATHRLIDAAIRLGARTHFPCKLINATPSDRGTRIQTSIGEWDSDYLILATGAEQDLPKRLCSIDLRQRTTPGIIVVTKPLPNVLRPVLSAPGVHVHQRIDGRVVIGEQAGAPANHADRLADRPSEFPSTSMAMAHADRMLNMAQWFIPKLADAEVQDVMIGWRPLPLDGLPVLGANPAVPAHYLAVMHSGVTLAPVIGQLVANEILSGQVDPRLSPYRPMRFG